MTEPIYDVAIIGTGIVGASIAYHLADQQTVVLLEGEAAPGYHTTGRSAALFCEAYGPPQIRGLTRASREFFLQPPADFTSVPLLRQRGTLHTGSAEQADKVKLLHDTFATKHPDILPLLSTIVIDYSAYTLEGFQKQVAEFTTRHADIDLIAEHIGSWPEHRMALAGGVRYALGGFIPFNRVAEQ